MNVNEKNRTEQTSIGPIMRATFASGAALRMRMMVAKKSPKKAE